MTIRKVKLTNNEVFVTYAKTPCGGWAFLWTSFNGSSPDGGRNLPRNIRAVLLARSRLGEVCPELVYSMRTGEILTEEA